MVAALKEKLNTLVAEGYDPAEIVALVVMSSGLSDRETFAKAQEKLAIVDNSALKRAAATALARLSFKRRLAFKLAIRWAKPFRDLDGICRDFGLTLTKTDECLPRALSLAEISRALGGERTAATGWLNRACEQLAAQKQVFRDECGFE